MDYLIYVIGAIVVLFILIKRMRRDSRDIPGIPKPRYKKELHHFSADAVNEGRKAYDKVMTLNKDHENIKALEEYASLVEELVKFTSMYLASSDLDDIEEVKKQAYYWGAWGQEHMKRTEDMAKKYNFVVVEQKEM